MECLMLKCLVWYFVERIEPVKAKRTYTDSDHASELEFNTGVEDVMTLLEAKNDHRTRVEGAVIELEAKNTTIDFSRDAGQSVTYTSSSSVKSEATTQRFQKRVDSVMRFAQMKRKASSVERAESAI